MHVVGMVLVFSEHSSMHSKGTRTQRWCSTASMPMYSKGTRTQRWCSTASMSSRNPGHGSKSSSIKRTHVSSTQAPRPRCCCCRCRVEHVSARALSIAAWSLLCWRSFVVMGRQMPSGGLNPVTAAVCKTVNGTGSMPVAPGSESTLCNAC